MPFPPSTAAQDVNNPWPGKCGTGKGRLGSAIFLWDLLGRFSSLSHDILHPWGLGSNRGNGDWLNQHEPTMSNLGLKKGDRPRNGGDFNLEYDEYNDSPVGGTKFSDTPIFLGFLAINMGIWWSQGPFDDWTLPISPWETGWGWSLAKWQLPAEWGQTLEKHGNWDQLGVRLGMIWVSSKLRIPNISNMTFLRAQMMINHQILGQPILGYQSLFSVMDFGINQLHSMEHLNLGSHCSCCSEKSITSCLFLWYVIVSPRIIPIVLQLSHQIICFIPSNIPIS